ncbi:MULTISPECIES: hypothetical protein [unclassified Clostridium]|uniref:hypothetical protein n=1 Tax=unclassified Clostridium TaxID=2614128 RepID=UPI000EDA5556|nr:MULTISPECIES: hypothetical protein [unclassified Clostridium]HCQ91701.1 hypothetical protein [Clostridium sp.]
MSSKTRKKILIDSVIFAIILVVFMLYISNYSQGLEFRSGKYYCKIDILNENSTEILKWDMAISKNNIKNNIIENDFNKETLENFRNNISEISVKRFHLFVFLLYLIFILKIFIDLRKDSQLYKRENNKKSLQLSITIIMIFPIYKIIISSIELNQLCKDVVYYFNLIK